MKKLILISFIGLLTNLSHAAEKLTSENVDTAIVTLDGHPLFRVRGMAGYPAEARAAAIERRIKVVAASPLIPTSAVQVVSSTNTSALMVNNTTLAMILEEDAATENLQRELVAEQARRNIIRALESYRHDRSAPILMRRTILAVTATLLTIVLLLGIGRLFRYILALAERHVKTKIESLETKSASAVESRPLWVAIGGVLNAVQFVCIILAVYFYLNLVLGLFPWSRPLAQRLFSVFVAPIEVLGTKFIEAIPDLIFLMILWFVVRYILKVTHLFFAGIERGTLVFENFDQDWAWPTYRIVRLLVLCFSVVVAYPYIPGSNSDAFKGVSLFVGVLFSLGSTSFIANMIAGIALTYRRAFRVGDLIKMGDAMGVVTDMRLQATHVRTNKNEAIVIPNSELVSSHVINYSTLAKGPGLILHTKVCISYDTPWRQVEAMLIKAAERTTGVKKDWPPFVLQRALGEFAVEYELNAYCETPLTMYAVYSALHKNILDMFNEYGVQIMTPAYEGDPAKPKVVPKEKWHASPAKPPDA